MIANPCKHILLMLLIPTGQFALTAEPASSTTKNTEVQQDVSGDTNADAANTDAKAAARENEEEGETPEYPPFDPRRFRKLFSNLDHPNGGERFKIESELLYHGDKSVVRMAILWEQTPKKIRQLGIDLAAQINTPKAFKFIADRAMRDKYYDVRLRAAEAIRESGSQIAFRRILQHAFDRRKVMRKFVSRAICNIGDKRYVDALLVMTAQKIGYRPVQIKSEGALILREPIEATDEDGNVVQSIYFVPARVEVDNSDEYATMLEMVTGERYGADLYGWATWWDEYRETFKFRNCDDKEK